TTTPLPAPTGATPASPRAPTSPSQTPSPAGPAVPLSRSVPDARGGRLATHVLRVDFIPVRDLIEPIKLLMTDGGVIMPYERLNLLILTDYTDSVQRILEIIRILDTNFLNPDLVELIKIKYNASADVVDDLKKIFGSG